MTQNYKNLPLKPETYVKVAAIAEANGYGAHGLGAQIEAWVERELPDCEHKKQAVDIEYFPNEDTLPLPGTLRHRTGWYCPTCKRVYARVTA